MTTLDAPCDVAAAASGLGFWGGALNWTIIGAVLLTILFIGSTIFTEAISSSKYPAYTEYKRSTSMIVPLPPRRRGAKARGKGRRKGAGEPAKAPAKSPAPKPA